MNRKLKVALRNSTNEQGFALPLAVGMGLIMILVGMTMVIRSQGDQVNASAQKGTAQSLAIAEGGIARTLSQLNQPNNRVLLTLDYDPDGLLKELKEVGESNTVNQWSGATSPSGGFSSCFSGSSGSPGNPNVSTVEETISSNGKYHIRAYRYSAGKLGVGTLLVEGKQRTATSRIQVSFPVRLNNFPGLYTNFRVKLQDTNVINLPAPDGGCGANIYCNPAGCNSPQNPTTLDDKKEAIGANANGQVDGEIYIKTLTLPPFPPNSWFDPGSEFPTTTGYYNLKALDQPTSTGVTSSYTLPRPGDAPTLPPPNGDGFYHYRIGVIDMQGDSTSSTLIVDTTNTPSVKGVKLYVTEQITLGGSAQIRNIRRKDPNNPSLDSMNIEPGEAGDLRIYVRHGQQIQIRGNSCVDGALIYAPETRLQVSDGGSGCTFNNIAVNANIKGAVWVKEWDGNGNDMGVAVPGDIGSQLADIEVSGFPPGTSRPGPISRWQRLEAK